MGYENEARAVYTQAQNGEEIDNRMDAQFNRCEFVFTKKSAYDFFKRAFDIICSLFALVILFPVMLIVVLIVALSDGQGHPFFVQKRTGRNGKEFKLIKLRTMKLNAECELENLQHKNEMDGPVFKIQDDPRITKVGKFLRKFGIDEIPQLLNILSGSMSFVGPRPPLPKEVEQYSTYDRARLLVKPGLTCYWQVSPKRNSVSFKEWMELDRKYIAERSFLLDIKLIFLTAIRVIVKHDGC